VLAVRTRADGPLARTTLAARVGLAEHAGRAGWLSVSRGQYDTAIIIQRARPGVTPGNIAVLLQGRARVLFANGQLEAAERDERAVIALFDSLGDRNTVPYAHAWQVLGQIQKSQGRLVEAEASLRRSLAVREAMRGNAVEIANVEGDIGKVRLAMGDHAGAAALLARSRARKVEALGALDPEVADDDVALAMVALADGRLAEARAFASTAANAYEASTVPVARAVQSLATAAEAALAAGDLIGAERQVSDALARLDAAPGNQSSTRAPFDSLRSRIARARQTQTASTSRKSSP
jgi:tetratricopeptide (TPR) repeat protein